jgi:hypothetical protein
MGPVRAVVPIPFTHHEVALFLFFLPAELGPLPQMDVQVYHLRAAAERV